MYKAVKYDLPHYIKSEDADRIVEKLSQLGIKSFAGLGTEETNYLYHIDVLIPTDSTTDEIFRIGVWLGRYLNN